MAIPLMQHLRQWVWNNNMKELMALYINQTDKQQEIKKTFQIGERH